MEGTFFVGWASEFEDNVLRLGMKGNRKLRDEEMDSLIDFLAAEGVQHLQQSFGKVRNTSPSRISGRHHRNADLLNLIRWPCRFLPEQTFVVHGKYLLLASFRHSGFMQKFLPILVWDQFIILPDWFRILAEHAV